MAIQFLCPGCGQPIEVDEPHAGKSAGCPYCQRVVSVPLQSTYPPGGPPPREDPLTGGGPPAARPAAREPDVAGGPDWAGPLPPLPRRAVSPNRAAAARRSGNIALACCALALLMGVVAQFLPAPSWRPVDTTGLSREESVKMQEKQLREAMEEFRQRPGLIALSCGTPTFVFLGLTFGIISIARGGSNWRGVLAVVIAGVGIGLLCMNVLAAMASFGPSGGG